MMSSQENKVFSKFSNGVFLLGCVIGFLVQAFEISRLYFDRNMDTTVYVEIPSIFKLPAIVLCFRYMDLLNYDDIRRFENITIPLNNLTGFPFDFAVVMDALTISNIFKYSPKVSEVFDNCQIRDHDSYNFKSYKTRECLKAFDVTKFYSKEYLCYKISPITNLTFSTYYFTTSLEFQNQIYGIALNKTAFKRFGTILPVMNNKDKLPLNSMGYAEIQRLKWNPTLKSHENYTFNLHYYSVTILRLPPPFPTSCLDYEIFHNNQYWCRDVCIKNLTVTAFNKLPFSGLITNGDSVNLKHISKHDLLNTTITNSFYYIVKNCMKKCKQLACHESYILTKHQASFYENSQRFKINQPREPFFTITFKPSIEALQFIIFVFSCFGTWFGISALSLNPAHILQLFMKKNKVRDIHTKSISEGTARQIRYEIACMINLLRRRNT